LSDLFGWGMHLAFPEHADTLYENIPLLQPKPTRESGNTRCRSTSLDAVPDHTGMQEGNMLTKMTRYRSPMNTPDPKVTLDATPLAITCAPIEALKRSSDTEPEMPCLISQEVWSCSNQNRKQTGTYSNTSKGCITNILQ